MFCHLFLIQHGWIEDTIVRFRMSPLLIYLISFVTFRSDTE